MSGEPSHEAWEAALLEIRAANLPKLFAVAEQVKKAIEQTKVMK